MYKQYDVTTKVLIESMPSAWVQLLGLPAQSVELIDADLATLTAAADKVCKISQPMQALVDLELVSSYKLAVPQTLCFYSVLLTHRHGLPVVSGLIVLRPEGDGPAYDGVYRQSLGGGQSEYLRFGYQVVRVWQVPVERLLTGQLGTLPLAPVAQLGENKLEGVIERMRQRIAAEADERLAGQLWSATKIMMGLRYEVELIERVLREVVNMEESVVYQAILEKGRAIGKEEGQAIGKEEGQVEECRQLLLRLGQRKFGPADESVRARIAAVQQIDRLEQLVERILDVGSWAELLADLDSSSAGG